MSTSSAAEETRKRPLWTRKLIGIVRGLRASRLLGAVLLTVALILASWIVRPRTRYEHIDTSGRTMMLLDTWTGRVVVCEPQSGRMRCVTVRGGPRR